MVNLERKKRIKQAIALLQIKLDDIEPQIENSDSLNNLYNKLLIKKAVLKSELPCSFPKNSLIGKVLRFFSPKRGKLISDYFKE